MTISERMRRIKSTGNASTEGKLMRILKRYRVTGWRRHVKVHGIRPDFVFKKTKIAMFADGCFWHSCPVHCDLARLKPYWRAKVTANAVRDRRQEIILGMNGWAVKRFWEHELI